MKCPECGNDNKGQIWNLDCPICDGFGSVEVGDGEDEWETCDECDGTGLTDELECGECYHVWSE